MVVLIVDSSTQVIQRLEELLSGWNFIKAIYTADSPTDARNLFTQYQPSIVLLDINIPENESLDLLAEISAGSCKTSVIVLFLVSNDYINAKYRLLGAGYFLDKYEDFEKIPGIIHGIAREKYKL
ncbi:MAG: response regulator [Chitinophagaceae bacterium]